MVQTMKEVLHKSPNPYLALLAYRDVPAVNGATPVQMLMGKQLQIRIFRSHSGWIHKNLSIMIT